MHRSIQRFGKPRAFVIDRLEDRCFFTVSTFTSLTTFTTGTPVPASTLAMDSSGDVFGTCSGGTTGNGYVWVLEKAGGTYQANPIILASFPADGSLGTASRAGVVIDSKGNLYGTNADGYTPFTTANVGTLWELPKTATGYGSLQLLKAFTDLGGQTTDALLTVDSNDNIFGNLEGVASSNNNSTIFKYSASGGYQDLFNYDDLFSDPNGTGGAESNLVMDTQGNLYGTTINGGSATAGAVFEIPVGYTSIHLIASFAAVNSGPFGQIAIINNGANSQIFGIDEGDEGGFTSTGNLWELPVSSGVAGALSILGSFTGAEGGSNGDNPAGGVTLAPDGNLYGTVSGISNSTTSTPGVWESVNSAGNFGAPQLVLRFPVTNEGYPSTNLITDGTNLFGATTGSGNDGILYGVGPSTIPDGGASTTATNYLLPAVSKTTLSAIAVGGQLIKGSVSVTVVNATTGIEKGSATVGYYAYDGTSFFLLGSQKHPINLRPGGKSSFHFAFKGTLNAGTYSVLPYSFDSTNRETGAATAQGLTVNAPFIALTATGVSAVRPASVKPGRVVTLTVTITNSGNISTSAAAIIAAALSIDGVTTAVSLPEVSHVYIIKAASKLLLHFKLTLPKTLTPGLYFPTISYTQNSETASAIGVAFTVTG